MFQDEVSRRLLKLYPRVVFTADSATRFEEFITERDLARAESALVAEPDESWREFAERARQATILDEVAESPFIKAKLDELRDVLKGNPYSDFGKTGDYPYAYRMLSQKREAVQIIRAIIEFLERDSKKRFRIERTVKEKRAPNIALYADNNVAVSRLFVRMAEVIGCGEKVEKFLRGKSQQAYLLILEAKDSRTTQEDRIDSAFIC